MSESAAGLYLHIPFCRRVCPYCDFAVRTGDRDRRRRFVEHLLAEIELWSGYERHFDTIYFGGGTPSALEPDDLERIVEAVRCRLHVAEDARIFLEVNPEDVDERTVEAWLGLGVGTLSLGVQSLTAAGLEFLGRSHSVDDVRRSIALARAAGFRTVSVDLIYGLPGQTASAWRDELDRAVELGPDHFSCYQLTIHERTRFGLLVKRGRLVPLPVEGQADLFRVTHRHLDAAGFAGYEVSQFATGPEHHSRHNRKYWDHTPYLGLGPAAHSYDDRRRWWNVRRTDPWQEQVRGGRRPVEGSETLGTTDLVLESLMTGLRTHAGVDVERVRQSWGVDLVARNRDLLQRLESSGLVRLRGSRIVPSLEGLAIADSLAARFEIGAA